MQTILNNITFGYYNPNVEVTFTAHDSISGIKEFTWSYLKESGASESNVAEYAETKVTAKQDSTDKSKYTATVTLPKSVADREREMKQAAVDKVMEAAPEQKKEQAVMPKRKSR